VSLVKLAQTLQPDAVKMSEVVDDPKIMSR
jgi:hypothetical protein